MTSDRASTASAYAAALSLLAPIVWASPSAAAAKPTPRPSVVVIVADDLGYADVGADGAKAFPTPHIDRLAREGIRFTDGYATASVCSPSRAGFHTGRYQARFGQDFNPALRETPEVSLPTSETTLAQRARSQGYVTGLIGKWHLGTQAGYHPMDRGYDEYFGFASSAVYLPALAPGDGRYLVPGERERAQRRQGFMRGRQALEEGGFLTDIVTREAVDFIGRHAADPFFLVVTHHAPHVPIEAPAAVMQRVAAIEDPALRTYAAMILSLDDSVGAILRALETHGRDRDTLVVFFSDNGCPEYLRGTCSNGEVSGFKRDLREGGVRIPMFWRWPGTLPAGRTVATPITTLDAMVSALSVTGADLGAAPRLDGRDLLPALRAGGSPTAVPLFWRAGDNLVVRDGRWKLWQAKRPEGGRVDLLFDLIADPGEQRNLAAAKPDEVSRLSGLLQDFQRGNVPPRWEPRRDVVDIAGQRIELAF